MHVAADLNWFLHFVSLAFAAAFGFLYLVRNSAYRYFAVDSNFGSTTTDFSSDRRSRETMAAEAAVGGAAEVSDSCAVCGLRTTKQCARCKMVKYCSETCQRSHWNSEHKRKCQELQSFNKANLTKLTSVLRERKASLVPARGSSKICKNSNKILFPYEEFVKFFNWDKPAYTPCGLINCGNSCFANVVLQCLSYTRPLVAYLLEKGHKMECQMDDWCFLCEFQTHVERASQSVAPFSPINIFSRLPNIGGNLGYGKQEDAHEFMRFAIDTMQSVCLEDFGGEKAVPPVYQQTTLIQHIFGGRLQSQVICTECNNVSNQFENMMDLTVEIHGDAVTLEECLHQFTAKEWLHGDNMYKCDGCNDYVKAWKRLSIQHAPNILTIALKRFQGGRFGKLNKRVNFPEKLDLRFYMVDLEDGNNYELYAVIVHVDMLNASFFGHYICYVKDFCGNWYRIDDCEVASVDLDEVLSQGAYMLLYSRVCAQPSCLLPAELLNEQENENVKIQAADPSAKQQNECLSAPGCMDTPLDSEQLSPANCSGVGVKFEQDLLSFNNSEDANGELKMASSEASLPICNGELHNFEDLVVAPKQVDSLARPTIEPAPASTIVIDNSAMQLDANNFVPSTSNVENASQGSRSYASEGLPRIVAEESTAAENCTLEEGNMRDVSPTTAGEGSEVNPANVGNAECRSGSSLLSENETKKAAKNSTGGSSGAKLKPVLVPGFLGKPPRKGMKQKTPQIHLNNQKNEVGGTLFVA